MARRKTSQFRAADLALVKGPHQWIGLPGIGSRVTLNSGGPEMLVVDINGRNITTAQADGTEHAFALFAIRPTGKA